MLFTRALLKVHPDLEQDLPVDNDLNSTCLVALDNWISSLNSYGAKDVILLQPTQYGSYSRSCGEEQHTFTFQFYTEAPESLLLKDFVNTEVPYELALETIRLLNLVAYRGQEIWTPEVIRETYGHTTWFGSDSDEEFLEQFEDMNETPFDPQEHDSLLPSAWCERMAESGYLPVGSKTLMSKRALNSFKAASDPRQRELVLAMQGIKILLNQPVIHSSEENPYERLMAAFVFLWDDSNFLGDAMDEVLDYRYNGGEASESQINLEYNAKTALSVCEQDIHFIERQLLIHCATGRLYDAIKSFCPKDSLV